MRALDGRNGLSEAVRTGQPYPPDHARPADLEDVCRLTAGLVADEIRAILVSRKVRTAAAQPDKKAAGDVSATYPDPRGMVIRGAPRGTTTTTTLTTTSGIGQTKCSVAATFDYAISGSFPIISLTSDDPSCGAYDNSSFWVVLFSWVGRALSVILAGFFTVGLTGITTRSPGGFS